MVILDNSNKTMSERNKSLLQKLKKLAEKSTLQNINKENEIPSSDNTSVSSKSLDNEIGNKIQPTLDSLEIRRTKPKFVSVRSEEVISKVHIDNLDSSSESLQSVHEKVKKIKKFKIIQKHQGDTSVSADSAPDTKADLIRRSQLQEYLYKNYCKSHAKPTTSSPSSSSEEHSHRRRLRNYDDDEDECTHTGGLLHLKKPCFDEQNESAYYDNHGRMEPMDWSVVENKKVDKNKPSNKKLLHNKKEDSLEKILPEPTTEFCNAVQASIADDIVYKVNNIVKMKKNNGDYSPLWNIDRIVNKDHPLSLEVQTDMKQVLNSNNVKFHSLDLIDSLDVRSNNKNESKSKKIDKFESSSEKMKSMSDEISENFETVSEFEFSDKLSSSSQKNGLDAKLSVIKTLSDKDDDMFDFAKSQLNSSSSNSSNIWKTSSKTVKLKATRTSSDFYKSNRTDTLDSDDASSVISDVSSVSSSIRFESLKKKLLSPNPDYFAKSYDDVSHNIPNSSAEKTEKEFLMRENSTRYFKKLINLETKNNSDSMKKSAEIKPSMNEVQSRYFKKSDQNKLISNDEIKNDNCTEKLIDNDVNNSSITRHQASKMKIVHKLKNITTNFQKDDKDETEIENKKDEDAVIVNDKIDSNKHLVSVNLFHKKRLNSLNQSSDTIENDSDSSIMSNQSFKMNIVPKLKSNAKNETVAKNKNNEDVVIVNDKEDSNKHLYVDAHDKFLNSSNQSSDSIENNFDSSIMSNQSFKMNIVPKLKSNAKNETEIENKKDEDVVIVNDKKDSNKHLYIDAHDKSLNSSNQLSDSVENNSDSSILSNQSFKMKIVHKLKSIVHDERETRNKNNEDAVIANDKIDSNKNLIYVDPHKKSLNRSNQSTDSVASSSSPESDCYSSAISSSEEISPKKLITSNVVPKINCHLNTENDLENTIKANVSLSELEEDSVVSDVNEIINNDPTKNVNDEICSSQELFSSANEKYDCNKENSLISYLGPFKINQTSINEQTISDLEEDICLSKYKNCEDTVSQIVICDETDVKKSSVAIEEIEDSEENITYSKKQSEPQSSYYSDDDSDIFEVDGFDCVNLDKFAPFAAFFSQLKTLKEIGKPEIGKIKDIKSAEFKIEEKPSLVDITNLESQNEINYNFQNVETPIKIDDNLFSNINVNDIQLNNCFLDTKTTKDEPFYSHLLIKQSEKSKSSGRLNKTSNALKNYQNKKVDLFENRNELLNSTGETSATPLSEKS